MKKIISLFMIAATMIAATACSNDDEPQNDGLNVYLNAIETLYDDEAKPKFTATDVPGIYIAIASSKEVSENFIARLIEDPSWDGRNITVNLDANGSLRIIGNPAQLEAGIFNEIIVNLRDYPAYTLQIIDEERAKNENGYTGTGVAKIDSEPDSENGE